MKLTLIIRYQEAYRPFEKVILSETDSTTNIFKFCEETYKVPMKSQRLTYLRDGFEVVRHY